jgi:hypothetical protein
MALSHAEALRRLIQLQDSGDPEIAHFDADKVLLLLIDDKQIREAFEAIDKWYA